MQFDYIKAINTKVATLFMTRMAEINKRMRGKQLSVSILCFITWWVMPGLQHHGCSIQASVFISSADHLLLPWRPNKLLQGGKEPALADTFPHVFTILNAGPNESFYKYKLMACLHFTCRVCLITTGIHIHVAVITCHSESDDARQCLEFTAMTKYNYCKDRNALKAPQSNLKV